jgi:hypothetical protein
MSERPRAFAAAFKAGAAITDENDFREFARWHPRPDNISTAEYATQLAAKGLAIHVTAEACRDIALFKQLMAEGRADGVPLIVTTGVVGGGGVPDLTPDASEAAKMAALAAVRAGVRGTDQAALAEARNPTPTTT